MHRVHLPCLGLPSLAVRLSYSLCESGDQQQHPHLEQFQYSHLEILGGIAISSLSTGKFLAFIFGRFNQLLLPYNWATLIPSTGIVFSDFSQCCVFISIVALLPMTFCGCSCTPDD